MAKVKVKAAARGTIVGADGTIIHCNPKGSDPRAREPIVDIADIPRLLERRLIVDPGDKLKIITDADAIPDFTGREDAVAAAAVGDIAKVDADAGPSVSGLETREVTHFDPAQGVGAAEQGLQVDDPDAPPAPAAPRRQTKS